MPRRKHSVAELKQSGRWNSLSKREQAYRIAIETPQILEAGYPPTPPGLNSTLRKLWSDCCEALAAERMLSKSDGPYLEAYVRAMHDGYVEAKHQISHEWLDGRQPFPEAKPDEVTPEPRAPTMTIPDAESQARAYAGGLIAGTLPAGKYAKLAARRFIDDLENGVSRDLTFDPAAAQHVVTYISKLGIVLTMWEIFVLANLFGFKRPDGSRRFREGLIIIAKKNGKTAFAAALSLYMADSVEGDREPNASCYIAATSKSQSLDLCFQSAKRLRLATPSLAERSRQFKSSIVFDDGSLIEPLAANSERLQGRNIHFGVLDELGDHKDSRLYSTFDSSTVGRRQPLVLSITTAGMSRDGIAWERRGHGIQVLEGADGGDSFFCFIAELDEGDDPFDEKVWAKANPSLGVLVTLENLREKLGNAKTLLSHKYAALRYHLNLWPITSLSPWVEFDDLDKQGCAYITDDERALPKAKRIELALVRHERTAHGDLSKLTMDQLLALTKAEVTMRPYCGGDFAVKNDLSVLCMLFPPKTSDGIWEAFYKVWIPEENITRRSLEDKVPYQAWADAGYVTVTPGSTTDFAWLEKDILDLHKKWNFIELGLDKSLIPDMYQRLEKSGIKITSVEQGFRLSPAIRRVEKLVAEHKFCSFGNAVFNWCARNVSLSIGKIKGDAQLEKVKSRERIDAATAAVIAMRIAMAQDQPASDTNPDKYAVRYFQT